LIQVERELAVAKTRYANQPTTAVVDGETKTEIKRLKEENTKLAEQLERYELRKDQMHMKVQ
jgi:cell shape-determining protein MreC